jgi:DNA-binding MarR family transcriptional regulator
MRSKANFAAAVSEVMDAVGMLVRRIRSQPGLQGLSLTEKGVISRLSREGEATTAELARVQGMKPQSMGAVVMALEQQGLVSRKPHATDGRQQLIEVTDAGVAKYKEYRAARRHWLSDAMQELSEEEQETVFAAGKILEQLAREKQ